MEISVFIVSIISFIFWAFLYAKAFPFFCKIEAFCNKLLTPVDQLCNLFSSRESFLGNNMIIRLIVVIGVFIASVGYIVISFFGGVDYVSLITSLLSGNALFGLMDLTATVYTSEGIYIYAAIISIGISSFLSFLYMRCTVETLDETSLPKAVKVLLLILFNVLFSFISFFLSEPIISWCSSAFEYIIRIYHQLAGFFAADGHSLWQLLKIIFIGLFFLVLLYAAFNAFVITFREILATIMYGTFAIGLLFIINVPIFMIPNFPPMITSFLSTICLIIPDYIRANEDAKDGFIDFVTRIGGFRR